MYISITWGTEFPLKKYKLTYYSQMKIRWQYLFKVKSVCGFYSIFYIVAGDCFYLNISWELASTNSITILLQTIVLGTFISVPLDIQHIFSKCKCIQDVQNSHFFCFIFILDDFQIVHDEFAKGMKDLLKNHIIRHCKKSVCLCYKSVCVCTGR